MKISRHHIAVFLVLIGAALSIASAVMYDQIIGKNSAEIKSLEATVKEKEKVIESIWQNSLALGNKQDALSLTLMSRENERNAADNAVIRHSLKSAGISLEVIPQDNSEALKSIMSAIDLKRTEYSDQINNIYLDKIQIQDRIAALDAYIDKFANLALFLQVIGLMLVLSKDIVL